MSLLMEALKRAQQEKQQSNKTAQAETVPPAEPPVASGTVEPVIVEPAPAEPVLEIPAIPAAPAASENKPAWTLEAAEVKPPKVDFDFSIDFPKQIDTTAPISTADQPLPADPPKPVPAYKPEPAPAKQELVKPDPTQPEPPVAVPEVAAPEAVTVAEVSKPIEPPVVPAAAETPLEKPAVVVVPAEKVRQQQPTKLGKLKLSKPIMIGSALLLLLLAGAGYYYYLLVNSPPPSIVLLPDTQIAESPLPVQDNASSVDVAAAAGDVAGDAASAVAATASAVAPATNALPNANKSVPVVAQVNPLPGKNKAVTAPIAASPQVAISKPAVQTPTPATPPMLVEKSDLIEPFQFIVQDAYKQYQQGNLERAAELYRQALKFDANSRDAILGLAVIAQRQGKLDVARQHYQQLLQINPKDHVAAGALLSLGTGDGAAQKISQLKSLLQTEPNAAHLHFALANEYGAQARWSEAQLSYFTAYSQAPDNADYAFNLAVSLERIGQAKAALDYYRRAQKLAENGRASFNAQRLTQRIDTLSAAKP